MSRLGTNSKAHTASKTNVAHSRKAESSGVKQAKTFSKDDDHHQALDDRVKRAEEEKEREDDLLREAEAVLAQTESVLKHRKEALLAKHSDVRESLEEVDFIFERRKFDLDPPARKPDHSKMPNFLDEHDERLLE